MKRAITPCRKIGCGGLCRDGTGYCESHKADSNWYKYSTVSRHERGYGTSWGRLRQKVLRRDKGLCQVCRAQGQITPANEVDHIIEKAHGGTDEPTNLQAICSPCHRAKTSRAGRAG